MKKTGFKRKILALLLSAATAVSSFSVTTFAQENVADVKTVSVADEDVGASLISVSGATLKLSQTNYSYLGHVIMPSVKVTLNSQQLRIINDYYYTFKNNTDPGTATVTVHGRGKYTGSVSAEYKINPMDISSVIVKASAPDMVYTGSPVESQPVLIIDGGVVSAENYTVSYMNNTQVGVATVTVTGKNGLKGSRNINYNIMPQGAPQNVENLAVKGSGLNSVDLSWSRTADCNGYEVYTCSYENGNYALAQTISSADKTTATVTGLCCSTNTFFRVRAYGTVNGQKYYSPMSAAVSAKTLALEKVSGFVSSGSTTSSVTVSWSKQADCTGYELYYSDNNGDSYTLAKKITDKNVISYKVENLNPSTEYMFRIRAYQTVNSKTGRSFYSQTTATTKDISAVVGLKAIAATENSVSLSWTAAALCSGYEIYTSTSSSSDFKLSATVSDKSKTTCTVTGLKASTTYYFKIRAYLTIGDKTVYSPYSSAISKQTSAATVTATTPVAKHGKLSVKGANIVDKNGDVFRLQGMSTHGIMWDDFSDILTSASLKVLRDDWKCNAIRIAMYTTEWGGYTTGSDYASQAKAKVETGVKNATDLGMYAVIDWHILSDGDPRTHQNEAVSFFKEMANKYKNQDNVIYEICNEPNGGITWTGGIKSYCETVVKAIRAYDSDAIIICGTGTWSQDIDQVLGNKLSDKNCVYALHFYANTHTDWLRDRLQNCYNKGLPVVVSEFGTCDSSGNGGFNESQTKSWMNLMVKLNVGCFNWSACGKSETASAFVGGTNLKAIKSGESQLTQSGKLIRSLYRANTKNT